MSDFSIDVLGALQDPALFGGQFDGQSWRAWRVYLAATFGLPLAGDDLELYRRHTGRQTAPTRPASEGYAVVGRRGGKSRIAALIATYLATCRDYSDILGPGERAVAMIIAPDRKQARVCHRYVRGLMERVPILRARIDSLRSDSIALTNRVDIEIHTASYRSVRGYTLIAAILDELAFWRSDESASPDLEVVRALRPAMATVPGSMLIGISSPYARRGALWEAYREHYGRDGDVMVWQGATEAMNPSVDRAVIESAYQADPVAASAEYGAAFRTDVESYVTREAVESAVVPGRLEIPPIPDFRYRAFVDPSGGSQDSMTLAVAHLEGEVAVLDAVREVRPPFSPEQVVADFCRLLKSYRIRKVQGDRYGGEWPRERFREAGLEYVVATKAKSDLYKELLPLVNSGRVELLDHNVLVAQLTGLERRTARGGRDSIDHAPRARDDVSNAAAGALVLAAALKKTAPLEIDPFAMDLGDVGHRHGATGEWIRHNEWPRWESDGR